MIQRRGFLTIAAASLLAVASGCRKPSSSNALRVGMDLNYPPFEMQDHSGEAAGISVELAKALATHLGRPLEIVPMDFSGLIPALKSGNIDLILSSMTATDERRKSILFSEPYAHTGLALLVGKNSSIQSIQDINKPSAKLTVKTGTTGDSWAQANLPQAQRVAFDDPAACVQEVAQGRADAFIYDQLSILRYSIKNAATTRGLLDPFVSEAWAVGIAQGNTSLEQKVNTFLNDFRKDRGFEKLGDQFLSEEKKEMEAAGIPFMLR